MLFLAQISASEAILAADAFVAERAVRAVFHVLAKIAVVAVVNVNAFVAQFAVFAIIAVNAIAGRQHQPAVHAVLVEIGREKQIAVFVFVGVSAIIGIFRAEIDIVKPRLPEAQKLQLFKEGHVLIQNLFG